MGERSWDGENDLWFLHRESFLKGLRTREELQMPERRLVDGIEKMVVPSLEA